MPERSPMARSCPAPKHCEYGRGMASSSLGSARIPTLVSEIQLLQPLQNRAVKPGWRKNKLCHSYGVTATLATKNHKALYSLLRDQEVACSLKRPPEVANSGGPVPARWPGPGAPIPVARPVPVVLGLVRGPVPVARSRSHFEGAWSRARAKKDLFCAV